MVAQSSEKCSERRRVSHCRTEWIEPDRWHTTVCNFFQLLGWEATMEGRTRLYPTARLQASAAAARRPTPPPRRPPAADAAARPTGGARALHP